MMAKSSDFRLVFGEVQFFLTAQLLVYNVEEDVILEGNTMFSAATSLKTTVKKLTATHFVGRQLFMETEMESVQVQRSSL